MDRARFEEIVKAYGAEPARWPAGERVAAAAYAEAHPEEADPMLAQARALDAMLGAFVGERAASGDLAARVLAQAPKAPRGFDTRALMALAACAIVGVLIGYSGGLLAPVPDGDDAYFVMAFEAPFEGEDG